MGFSAGPCVTSTYSHIILRRLSTRWNAFQSARSALEFWKNLPCKPCPHFTDPTLIHFPRLACGHLFCKSCITDWADSNPTSRRAVREFLKVPSFMGQACTCPKCRRKTYFKFENFNTLSDVLNEMTAYLR